MTIIKPDYVEEITFSSVREAGYAEEEVDEFTKAIVGSYNRLIDAKYDSEVQTEELIESNLALVDRMSTLQTLVDTVDARVESAEFETTEVRRELVFTENALASARLDRDEQFEQVKALTTANGALVLDLETAKEDHTRAINEAGSLIVRINELEAELSAKNEEVRTLATAAENTHETISEDVTTPETHAEPAVENETVVANDDTYFIDALVVGENVNLPTVDEAKGELTTVLNDSNIAPSDRAAKLLNKAYALGEEYIVSANKERVEILGEARQEAEAAINNADVLAAHTIVEAETAAAYTLNDAMNRSEALIGEATEEAETILFEAKHEADHVATSVVLLREERDETLGRLRDFFIISRERVEEIADLPDYEEARAAELEKLNSYSPETNTDLDEAEQLFNQSEREEFEDDETTFEDYVVTPLAPENNDEYNGYVEDKANESEDDDDEALTHVELPSYEQEVISEFEPEVQVPVVDAQDVYFVDEEEDAPAVFNNPTESISIVRNEDTAPTVEQMPADKFEYFGEDNSVEANETTPAVTYDDFYATGETETKEEAEPTQQFSSFTDVLKIPAQEKAVETDTTDEDEEPKKKKGGFMSILNKKMGS